MANISYPGLLFAFLVFLGTSSLGWGYDCSNVLVKGSYGLLSYHGNIEFPAPHKFSGQWSLEAVTDTHFGGIGGGKIWLNSDPEAGSVLIRPREENNEIKEGDKVTIDFRIRWDRYEPEPDFISMIWDGVQICEDDGTGPSLKGEGRARRSRRNNPGSEKTQEDREVVPPAARNTYGYRRHGKGRRVFQVDGFRR